MTRPRPPVPTQPQPPTGTPPLTPTTAANPVPGGDKVQVTQSGADKVQTPAPPPGKETLAPDTPPKGSTDSVPPQTVQKPAADVNITRAPDGLPTSTTDGADLARDFAYTTDASGASSVSKNNGRKKAAEQIVLEKSATQDNLWTVHRADGTHSTAGRKNYSQSGRFLHRFSYHR